MAGRRGGLAGLVFFVAACGAAPAPLVDASAARICDAAAAQIPRTTVATAFTTTLGRIRSGGYPLDQPDPFGRIPDVQPVVVCTLDTPKVGDPTVTNRITIAVVDEAAGSVLIGAGTTETLPVPTP